MPAELLRNLEWQVKTYLAEKTIENLRKGWSWEMTPEENLTVAVTNAVPFIFENHGKWCEEKLNWELNQEPSDHPPPEPINPVICNLRT